ncbi:MAG: uracil-DNA glycosylase [Rhodoferax sp.]|nr:uracil-DNA glycosylase [Rhodoferax sp.]OIP25157.1 MAG: hypothetical protein AUK52_01050 [Comamonadaceae bacterium CG2_30_60_41]PIW06475.1 MAG: uracil-DNA glycosylase [Comamonadaceae bacterium CG17_big_fil_post_rev_8_21_14_2_50_60_13]PIY27040.1 MAG: uracil-DNA glycosylase [Comamonadaceae bacterium CG_4_10_14_3_um_filter_60_75]PJC16314.1 MAG: uracil-DNA glycosylase [Comamonadaceae bacterium CG_4_9_14_0_8_um_filter_60_18]
MSLDLDPRQRAMLAEMGVRVWWRSPAAPANAVSAASASAREPADGSSHGSALAPRSATNTRQPATPNETVAQPVTLTLPATDTTDLDWPALAAAVASCQACAMCQGRRAPVLAAPTQTNRADWLVLGEPPDEAQERAGQPFVGDAGLLLDNMLKAVGVCRLGHSAAAPAQPSAYLSLVLKCRPALPTAPNAQALQACAAFLRREITLVQPKVIVAMGRLAMQLLLSEDHPQGLKLPLGKLRGQVWHFQGVPVVVTYPPAYLLRNGQDKARAWEDLCLAADVAEGKYKPL